MTVADYTHKNLGEVTDSAPGFGFGEMGAIRFAKDDLDAERTGITHLKLNPGQRIPFGHKHDEAEEIYVVVAGSGRVKLDDEIIEIVELDAIRVSPPVGRAFEAGPEGITLLAVGARHDGDGELLHDWWTD
jgi:mannose-6-phosphate isomerase-like protein (cupin superfamily)